MPPEKQRQTQNPKQKQGDAAIAAMLDMLVCPLTKTALLYDAEQQELVSKEAGLAYPVRDGIPIMLPQEARKITE